MQKRRDLRPYSLYISDACQEEEEFWDFTCEAISEQEEGRGRVI